MVTISDNFGTKWYQSLKLELFAAVFLVGILPVLVFSMFISDSLKTYFKENNEKELLYKANKIAVSIQKNNYLTEEKNRMQFVEELDAKSEEEGYRIIVTDSLGVAVADTNRSAIGKMCVVPEILVALDGKDDANLRDSEGTVYASAYIENEGSEKIGAVLLVYSFDEVNELLKEISHNWLIVTIVIAVLLLIIAFLITHAIFVPLTNILSTIQRISNGQLHNRLVVKGNNELSRLGDAINVMTQQLEHVDTARQEFVSNVSHELKTPLSSIKVLSESLLLQEDMPVEMYREFMQDINSEVDRMTDIINDLLALVKLDYREEGMLNISEFSLNEVVTAIVKRISPLANKKNIMLDLENIKDITIEADETKLTLALSNLIENAVKYTPDEGTVTVTVDGDHQNAFFTVKDTGIGISPEEQTKIFNRFYRVDKTRDRETGGTGLGLAITHSTVMMHNGSIKVTSAEGEGATFVVRIPLKHQSIN